MRRRRRLEGCLPIASYKERERGLYFISGPGGEKKKHNKNQEQRVYKPLKCFNQRKAQLKAVLETFLVFPCTPGLWMWSLPVALGGEQGEEGR